VKFLIVWYSVSAVNHDCSRTGTIQSVSAHLVRDFDDVMERGGNGKIWISENLPYFTIVLSKTKNYNR